MADQAGRRVHRQRVHHPLSHPFVGGGARRRHPRHLESRPAPTPKSAAALARSLRVGDAKAFGSIEAMVADASIDCIWICGPNFARVENMERIVARDQEGREAARHRLREAARPQRRRGRADGRARRGGRRAARLSRKPAVPAESRTRQADRLGARRRARRAVPISRARPRNTAVRTCRGSGRAICRAAACSTT